MAKQTLLTDEGLKNYEQELEYLKTVKRKEVAEKIKVALSFGDLSENSEYDEAKNDQAMLEARISQIEAILKNAKIIDESELNADYILPHAFDPRVGKAVAEAVKKAAIDSGVARI